MSGDRRVSTAGEDLHVFLNQAIFLFKKTGIIRKMITEREIGEMLRRSKLTLPPLAIRLIDGKPAMRGGSRPDALIEASWRGMKARFVVEFSTLSTPKGFQGGLNQLRSMPVPKGYEAMLLFPFLAENQLQELEREGISGIDLCGNGVVIATGKFSVYRSGEKNRFRSTDPIKNIYRKNSSLVGRAFLSGSGYDTVQGICESINQRNLLVSRWERSPMSLSTVSKALKTLEEDLIIERGAGIRLLQSDTLLEKLAENYVSPKIMNTVRLKVPEVNGTLLSTLREQARALDLPLMATGTSSVAKYAVMQRGDMLSVYCPRLDLLVEQVPGSSSDRFPNLELIETEDETVYFDAAAEEDFWWASPVQVYLELMVGDKRDQETAEQVKAFILASIEAGRQ